MFTKRKKYSALRPDGTVFRSWRSQPPDASWLMIEIDGATVLAQRRYLDLGGQRRLAERLSTATMTYGQPEIAELEHGGCWVNRVYLDKLAVALDCDPILLVALSSLTVFYQTSTPSIA